MQIQRCIRGPFSVIGKEGSTKEGTGFVPKLWVEANERFDEIAKLVKCNPQGNPLGIWGLMTDFSRSFHPWEEGFSQGLYLAGAEAKEEALPPPGWVKWTVPAYEYLYAKVPEDTPGTFRKMMLFLQEHRIHLAGSVHEFYCPEEDGTVYLFFPIRTLEPEELARLAVGDGQAEGMPGRGQVEKSTVELRDRTPEEVRIFWERTQDEEIKRLFPGGAVSMEEALAWYEESLKPGATSYGKSIFWNGIYVGDIWCYNMDEEKEKSAMVSFVLFKKSLWGRGITGRALELFIQELFSRYKINTLGAFVYNDNRASLRLLESAGFVQQEVFDEDGRLSSYFERKRQLLQVSPEG